ncbi:cytochrome bd-I oxidase subunit CydX [Roseinatronobacter sp. S2]|nr:cytochrome bd-I oxidase subunit CydX [Roseinatronobacter sp. S2]WFE75892.1 cytochrome bd-I oxidase subunit CydX [Roseinatronobacter sp. S2]
MWYFAWLLGLPLAAMFAVMNAMWFEMREDKKLTEE